MPMTHIPRRHHHCVGWFGNLCSDAYIFTAGYSGKIAVPARSVFIILSLEGTLRERNILSFENLRVLSK